MGSMTNRLPWPRLRIKWTDNPAVIRAMDGYKPAPFGRVKPLRGKLVALDACYNRDGTIDSVKTAYLSDHPFLRRLNALPHVPRIVKAQYRKEVRLARAMMTDWWAHGAEWDAAEAAWRKYNGR